MTGLLQLSDSEESHGGPGVFLETLIGGLGALAVLAFVFASLLAFVPLLIAAVAILATLLVVLALTYIADVSFIVQFLVSLVGLGVAIDYSLLIVTRWREERAHGRENHEAVVAAMATAGRAVVLSGLTVAIGLIALVVLPVPGLRSVGYGGHADPAGLDLRGADAAAGAARRHRAAGGLAADPPRGPRQPRLDGVDADARAPPLGRRRRLRSCILAVLIVPVLQPDDRRNQRQRAGRSGRRTWPTNGSAPAAWRAACSRRSRCWCTLPQAGAVRARLAAVAGDRGRTALERHRTATATARASSWASRARRP